MTKSPRSAGLFAFGAALALATVAVLPALVALRTSPDFPVQVFTVDDGLYLQRAIGAWQGADPYEWTYFENASTRPLMDVALARPNAVVDIAAGALASALHLSATGLAVFLDWTCGALSIALFFAIFRCWAGPWPALGAAILAVAFPGVLVPGPLLLLPSDALPHLVSQPFIDHASPAFRAVYTQASYPLFLLAVLGLVRRLRGQARGAGMFALGTLGGLTGYGYFFPWLASLAIGMGLPALAAILGTPGTPETPSVRGVRGSASSPRARALGAAAAMAAFLAGWVFGSAGVFYIIGRNATSGIVEADVVGQYWWLPVERLLLAAVLLVAAYRERRDRPERATLVGLLGFLLVLELPLMNLQPLLRQGLAPYHWPGFYLHPLVTGGLFLLLVEWLGAKLSMRLLSRFVCALPLIAFGFDSAIGVRAALHPLPLAEDLGWLVRRLRETPADAVFAMNPIKRPFSPTPPTEPALLNLPNFVSTLSGRHTLHQEWMFNEMTDDGDLRRELGMAWLLSGRVQPLWTLREPVELPGDLFTLTWTFLELRRRQKLELHGSLLREWTACRFLNELRVDLLVHDRTNDGALADPASRFLVHDASSPHGTFDVYRFDRPRAAAKACAGGRRAARGVAAAR